MVRGRCQLYYGGALLLHAASLQKLILDISKDANCGQRNVNPLHPITSVRQTPELLTHMRLIKKSESRVKNILALSGVCWPAPPACKPVMSAVASPTATSFGSIPGSSSTLRSRSVFFRWLDLL